MKYVSTRGGGEPLSFTEILLAGMAPDGGLYMPGTYPKINLEMLRGQSYTLCARYLFHRFAPDMPMYVLKQIMEKTYAADVFGSEEITPIKWLEPGLGLLQLSNGPTLAFKDVPLQLLGNLMEYTLREKGEELNILGATSGDTGSAAAYALRGKKGLRLFMLSPKGRMSRFQQMQMYTLDEPNVFNIVIDGTFDDCQSLVKEVNADADFKRAYKIGAVNSINWARIAAQIVYYVYAYLQATKSNTERVTFAVPSGNFGNALSAYIAKQMGLPIDIIVATNENDVLDEFFQTDGIYRVRKGSEVKITSSPSMDIASASNFERLIYDLTEQSSELVRNLWRDLAIKGQFDARFLCPSENSGIRSGSADDEDVLDTIRYVYSKYGVIIDPHTAVAMKVGLEYQQENVPLIVAETAQPAKFSATIMQALHVEPLIPKGYEHLLNLPEHTHEVAANAYAVKKFIAQRVLEQTT